MRTKSTPIPCAARRLRERAFLAIATALTAACAAPDSGADGSDRWNGLIEEIGRLTIVRNAGGGAWTVDTVVAHADLVIGDLESEPNQLLGNVFGLEVDDAGRIYVSDILNVSVRVFGDGPVLLATIGRNGDGPGEYRFPSGLVFDTAGTLYLRDAERINLYRPRTTDGIADSAVATWPIPFPSNDYSADWSRVGPDGEFYYPHYCCPFDGPPRFFYVVFRNGEAAADTLSVPAYDNLNTRRSASFRISPNSGRMVRWGSAAPFAAAPSWDVTSAGTLVSSDGRSYTIHETNPAGDTTRIIERPVTPVPVPGNERRDSMVALQERIDSLPVPLDRVEGLADEIRTGRLPETLPAVLSLHVAKDGRLWVKRWPPARGETAFDVFDPRGIHLGTVIVPATLETQPPPLITANALYAIVRDPDTDVQQLVRFRFDVPSVEAPLTR
ncbi:MAG: hypothetical protein L0271_22865 [Gemmatimonadetes bacterium]|nr:hypothetical protein [Gemmatimonadota bacterium]